MMSHLDFSDPNDTRSQFVQRLQAASESAAERAAFLDDAEIDALIEQARSQVFDEARLDEC